MSGSVLRASAPAKINLALVVGGMASHGKHEVVSVMQQIDLVDTVEIRPAQRLEVNGFGDDTIVRAALGSLAAAARVEALWKATIVKRVPVKAGLGGGSSDAAAALRLANSTLSQPLSEADLSGIAGGLGADVPFFLQRGTALATGDGSIVQTLPFPHDFHVLLVLPAGATKESTAAVYRRFDDRDGQSGFDERRQALIEALQGIRAVSDIERLPPNDLCSSPLAARLRALGAIRADVSGAGPVVYAIFVERAEAAAARLGMRDVGETWLAAPW